MLVSCLLVFHDEGTFAHTTLYSAELCRRELEAAGHQAEFIILLDRADERTKRAVEACSYLRPADRLVPVDFGNAAMARNHGVALAQGDFVAILPALDFIGVNFLADALAQAKEGGRHILWHPELVFTIDADRRYFWQVDQRSSQFRGVDLFDHNLWRSCAFGWRDAFLKVPYAVQDGEATGLGQSVWQWNCDTIAAGMVHGVVPHTVLFERHMWNAGARQNDERNAIPGPSAFFNNLELLHSHGHEETFDLETWRPLPEWAREAMLPYGRIYAELLHEDWVVGRSQFSPSFVRTGQGVAYASLLAAVGDYKPTHIILVPWLKPGGFDLGMIHHVNALSALGRNVLVISTEPTESTWTGRMDPAAKFVNFRDAVGDISHEMQMNVLLRYLLQAGASVLHIGNSNLGWQVFRKWPKQISAVSKVFTTLVCDDESISGTPIGYARDFMQIMEQDIVRIFCDNTAYPRRWSRELGIEAEKFCVLKFPTILPESGRVTIRPGRKSILWAGRLDRQKRPGLLLEIARLLPDFDFHVYGVRIMNDDGSDASAFSAAKNITIHGPYDGFPSLPHERFDLFLYTSSWDGMPNVLLEATAHGLPIVAPVVGGIGDLLNEETGYPVFDTANPTAFVSAIRELTGDVVETERRWKNAFATVRDNYTDEIFIRTIQSFEEYSL